MLKKSAIIGFIILIVGAVLIGRILYERKKEQHNTTLYKLKYSSESDEYLRKYHEWLKLPPQDRGLFSLELNKDDKDKSKAPIILEQQERLKADMDKLAAGEINPSSFADALYGENWRNDLNKYKKRKELTEIILTGSIVCASSGGIIFAWCLLLWTARFIIKCLLRLTDLIEGIFKRLKKIGNNQKLNFFTDESAQEHEQKTDIQATFFETCPEPVNVSCEKNFETYIKNRKQLNISEQPLTLNNQTCENFSESAEGIAVLLSDKKSTKSQEPSIYKPEASFDSANLLKLCQSNEKITLHDSHKDSAKHQESLKTQTENLEKQIAEFKKMAQNVQKTTLEHSKPLNSILKELTQQVSAIRQYASYQQDRIEKLQEGYDWNIIRTFCLRVIHCLDNLEVRINQLHKNSIETEHLNEVKDELLFALESSGIERFEPEVNSDYRGLEKFAEAIKEKKSCDDPNQTGKIAEVIRPGYQYFIDEDNIKVVRTAQVKLYG